jgi:hypothetical protein
MLTVLRRVFSAVGAKAPEVDLNVVRLEAEFDRVVPPREERGEAGGRSLEAA